MKDTKFYVPVVTLSTRNNPKLSKLLNKGFERSYYWNKYKTKSENKSIANKQIFFLNQILLQSIDVFLFGKM